jgi:hypothetical protein
VLPLVAALALGGCSTPGWLRVPDVSLPDVDLPSLGADAAETHPAPDAAVEVLTDSPEVAFHARASQFYGRLTGRRFNSLASFRDDGLREYFESTVSFSDYFADLAQDLAEAHFERNQPVRAEVEEFLVEGPGRARVRVRLAGENGMPLRFWGTKLVREDRWERRDGRWWIVPSAL